MTHVTCVMSHTYVGNHVTHICWKPCHTHIWNTHNPQTQHVTYIYESRHMYVSVMNVSCHTCRLDTHATPSTHVTHINGWHHTYEWVMSHKSMCHVTWMNDSCDTYQRNMSHIFHTYQCDTSHMLQYISMWHVTHVAIHINATRHTCCNTYQCDTSHLLQYISMRYVTCVHESWMNHGTAIECTLNNHLRTTQQALKKHSTTTRVPLKYRTTQIQYHSNTVPLKYQSIVNNHPIHPPTLAKDLMSDLTHESASQMRHEWFGTLECFTDESASHISWVISQMRMLLISHPPARSTHPPTHPLDHPFIHPTTHTHTPTSETASLKKTCHPQNRRELVPVPARVCLVSRVGVCVCVAALCLVLREAPQMSLLTFLNVRGGGSFDKGNIENIMLSMLSSHMLHLCYRHTCCNTGGSFDKENIDNIKNIVVKCPKSQLHRPLM